MTILGFVQGFLLILGAADTACAESGRDYADGAAVLQVVRTRAKLNERGWKRYDGTLWTALWSPQQHAHGCRWPLTFEHLRLGVQFVTNTLETPEWAKKALYYCGKWDKPRACLRRGARHQVGTILHDFWK